jgi:hypothetical protein
VSHDAPSGGDPDQISNEINRAAVRLIEISRWRSACEGETKAPLPPNGSNTIGSGAKRRATWVYPTTPKGAIMQDLQPSVTDTASGEVWQPGELRDAANAHLPASKSTVIRGRIRPGTAGSFRPGSSRRHRR